MLIELVEFTIVAETFYCDFRRECRCVCHYVFDELLLGTLLFVRDDNLREVEGIWVDDEGM